MANGIKLLLDFALCLNNLCGPDSNIDIRPNDKLVNVDMNYLHSPPSNREIYKSLGDNINGAHLKVVTMEDYPLSYTGMNNITGKLEGKGVSFQLFNFLAKKYNFTYDVFKPPENKIGSSFDYKDSLIEMVNNSQVDVAVAFIPLLADQRNFTFYSTTALDEGEWIMIMTRPQESATGAGLTAPFDKYVWALIVVSLIITGPAVYAVIILRNRVVGNGIQPDYSLGHVVWFVYGALLKQGSTLSPIAGKFFFFTLLIVYFDFEACCFFCIVTRIYQCIWHLMVYCVALIGLQPITASL